MDPNDRVALVHASGELKQYNVETTYFRLWRMAADGLVDVERHRGKLYVARADLARIAELVRARQPAARKVLGLSAPAASSAA